MKPTLPEIFTELHCDADLDKGDGMRWKPFLLAGSAALQVASERTVYTPSPCGETVLQARVRNAVPAKG